MEILNRLKNYVKSLISNPVDSVEDFAKAADSVEKVVDTAKKVKKIAKTSGFPTGKLAKAKTTKAKTTKKKKDK